MSNKHSNDSRLHMAVDSSVERAMYDEILGPLVSRGAANYHNYLATLPSDCSSVDASTSERLPRLERPTTSPMKTNHSNSHHSISTSTNDENNHNNASYNKQQRKDSSHSRPSSSSNADFTTSIVSRLAIVEGEYQSLRRLTAEKVKYIEQLEKDNAALRLLTSTRGSSTSITRLSRELTASNETNLQLQKELIDIKQFLSDYGLVWVGNTYSNSDSHSETNTISTTTIVNDGNDDDDTNGYDEKDERNNSMKSSYKGGLGLSQQRHTIKYADFEKKINELNALICSEPAQIVTSESDNSSHRRARLVQSSELVDNIRIVYYRNGLMIRRGPFRVADSREYRCFVQDILDGYFPSEYRDDYPNGVIFNLIDKGDDDYVEGCSDDVSNRMSASVLLKKLPKTVLKNGEIVDVRNDISSRLNGSPSRDKLSTGTVAIASSNTITIDTAASSISDVSLLASIQIKWIDGRQVHLKMHRDDIVGDVREVLRRHFFDSNNSSISFELRSAYPSHVLGDSATLAEAGVIPNGIIHARRVASMS